jgi:hypothetical protein
MLLLDADWLPGMAGFWLDLEMAGLSPCREKAQWLGHL